MARMVNITCSKCGRNVNMAIGAGSMPPMMCHDCQKKERNIKRREYFSGLDGLTVEERLRKIEEILYDAPWKTLYNRLVAKY